MPTKCEVCGQEHKTKEELDEDKQNFLAGSKKAKVRKVLKEPPAWDEE